MIIVLLLSTNYFSINIENTHLNFLDILLKEKIFQVIFTVLCFLFIINGSNLIDGFNGLLGIHLITINLILLFINLLFPYIKFICQSFKSFFDLIFVRSSSLSKIFSTSTAFATNYFRT